MHSILAIVYNENKFTDYKSRLGFVALG